MTSLSVVIPTYNHSREIGRAIDSVLAQTRLPDEIIVVDDGSQDDTQAALEPYQDHITYHYQENRGVSAARNTGIFKSGSNWIAFLDADDLWAPEKLANQVERIALLRNDVACVYSRHHIQAPEFSILSELPPHGGNLTIEDLLLKNWVGLLTVAARRDVLLELGGFDEKLRTVEDWDLWLRMHIFGWRFSYIREPLATYSLSEFGLHSDAQLTGESAKQMFARIFAMPDVNERVLKLKPMAEANYSLELATHCASLEDKSASWNYFKEAVRTSPRVLLKLSTCGIIIRLIAGNGLYALLRRINRATR